MVCLFDSLGLVCFVLALESHLRVDGMDGWMARHYGEIILCFITFFHIGGRKNIVFMYGFITETLVHYMYCYHTVSASNGFV